MELSTILLIILILITLGLIIAVILERHRLFAVAPSNAAKNRRVEQQQIEDFLSKIQDVTDWKQEPSPSGSAACKLYTFPAESRTEPTPPTYNKSVIDTLEGTMFNPKTDCYDVDQLAASEVIRTCEGDVCITESGQRATRGEQEVLYVPCSLNKCSEKPFESTLGLISVGFSPQDPPIPSGPSCITVENGEIIPASPSGENVACSLQKPSQFFRITRYDFDGRTTTENYNGVYAKIVYRETGMCLAKENPMQEFTPGGLILEECSNLPNDGIVWFLVSPIQFGIPPTPVSPQQMVYTTKLVKNPNTTEFKDLIFKTQGTDMEPLSMQSHFTPSSPLTSQKIVVDKYISGVSPDPPPNLESANTQILDYALFREILTSPNTADDFPAFPFWAYD